MGTYHALVHNRQKGNNSDREQQVAELEKATKEVEAAVKKAKD